MGAINSGKSVSAESSSVVKAEVRETEDLSLAHKLIATAPQQIDTTPIGKLSTPKLEQRIRKIDQRLKWLCPISLRSGVGAVGYRSEQHRDATTPEWVQIDLKEPSAIDQVMLVPTIWRDTKTGLRADGFPLEFQIVVGTAGDVDGTVVASFTKNDHLLPRIAPLAVTFPTVVASWVRVEVSLLSPRAWDGRFALQLSELLVFSGPDNVALHKPVSTSSSENDRGEARHKRFLVDGFLPYLMDAREGEQSIAFFVHEEIGDRPTLTIDTGAIHPVDRIHVHAVDLNDTIPQAYSDDFGIPKRLLVEGSHQRDFSDSVRLFEFRFNRIYDVGPIMIGRFRETPCRYIRFVAMQPDVGLRDGKRLPRLGFAEIEVFSKNRNVALGNRVSSSFSPGKSGRKLSAITDGKNFYGSIMPMRLWLNELSWRHDLQAERPVVLGELRQRYVNQKTYIFWMKWLAILLAAGIGITFLIDRIVRKRQLANLRTRFAADLHDELGANLHVIGLLGDLAQSAVDSPDKLRNLHQRIETMAKQSGAAVRHCTEMLEDDALHADLLGDLQRSTQRITPDIEGKLSFEGDEAILRGLKPRTRADLFLFYKECLVNISRHSGATHFSARLMATRDQVCLTVIDNGKGLEASKTNEVPGSLKRRARLLGSQVTATTSNDGGTQIFLSMEKRKWRRSL